MTTLPSVTLYEGDNRVSLRRLIDQGVRVHSCVCDPPYGLTSVVKRFGKKGAAAAKFGSDGAFQRTGAGFMGQEWDGSGIERDPEFWRLIHDILLPGGFCIAFSGARTGHWQAVAMEQAGFIMHPMTGWVFGSGFPKAHNAAKAIDKMLGAEPTVVGHEKFRDIRNGHGRGNGDGINAATRDGDVQYIDHPITTATTAAAAAWEGWAYGAQALKPALEPIYIGQKPFATKTGAANLVEHGVGAMNIDGCRVVSSESRPLVLSDRTSGNNTYADGLHGSKAVGETTLGRHPANLLHDDSDEVRALFPDSRGQIAKASSSSSRENQSCYGDMRRGNDNPSEPRQDDDTSAARFFNAFPVEPDAIYYNAKASSKDRVTQCLSCGRHGVGGKPDCACENRKTRGHPTVKPIALMQHLVRLVTPPGGTVLDPFAGTGTTGAAAREEGFNCILMEAQPEYIGDIRARLDLGPANPSSLDPDIAALLGETIASETDTVAAQSDDVVAQLLG